MRTAPLLIVLVSLSLSAARAGDAVCSKLSWPLDHERALLNGTLQKVESGATLTTVPDKALSLALKPTAAVTLPLASPTPGNLAKFSGFVTLPVAAAGDYLISLSTAGWIDIVQGDALVASTGHTSDDNCPGLRKSVRFALAARPATIELTNVPADHIAIAITPAQ